MLLVPHLEPLLNSNSYHFSIVFLIDLTVTGSMFRLKKHLNYFSHIVQNMDLSSFLHIEVQFSQQCLPERSFCRQGMLFSDFRSQLPIFACVYFWTPS